MAHCVNKMILFLSLENSLFLFTSRGLALTVVTVLILVAMTIIIDYLLEFAFPFSFD